MANPMKGEARFEAAGEAWTLTFDFNTLVTLEDELEVKVDVDRTERCRKPKIRRELQRS